MFCSNCGNQIPDNTPFCNYCGAQQQTVQSAQYNPQPTPQPVPQPTPQYNPQPPVQKKKKSNGALIVIIVVLVLVIAFLIGKFIIAPYFLSDPEPETEYTTEVPVPEIDEYITEEIVEDPEEEPSVSPYDAVFEGTSIVHYKQFFGLETKNYACIDSNGNISCYDYGCEDDVIKEWVETIYMPVSSYSDSEKEALESEIKSNMEYYIEALPFMTVSYNMGENFFKLSCTYKDLDNPENCTALYNVGLLTKNTFASMSVTEKDLLAQGYVKK